MHRNRPVPRHTKAQLRHTQSQFDTFPAHRHIRQNVACDFLIEQLPNGAKLAGNPVSEGSALL